MTSEGRRTPAGLGRTVPALPVRDVARAVAHLRDRFGFAVVHEEDGFAVLARDDAVVHLWDAVDGAWCQRADLAERPVWSVRSVRSGAESFLAGTASCRIETGDVDGLFAELREAGVLHAASADGVRRTEFGTREFATVDLDGNLLEFFRWDRG